MRQISLKIFLASIILGFLGLSCKRNDFLDANGHSNPSKGESSAYSLAINKKNGEVQLFKDFNTDPNYVTLGSDMLVHKDQIETIKKYQSLEKIDWDDVAKTIKKHKNNQFAIKKQATKIFYGEPVCIWEGADRWWCNDVYIHVSNKFTEKQADRITNAIFVWAAFTKGNISWHVTVEGDRPFVNGMTRIEPSGTLFKECVSTLGSLPVNRGVAYISDQCTIADIIHNLGHILGFVNEEQRPRRDQSIMIQQSALDIIKSKFGSTYYNFIKASLDTVSVQSDNSPFNFESIMMNSSYSTNKVIEDFLREHDHPLYTDTKGQPIESVYLLSPLDVGRARTAYPLIDHDDETRSENCPCKL